MKVRYLIIFVLYLLSSVIFVPEPARADSFFSKPAYTPSVSDFLGMVTVDGQSAEIGDEVAVYDPDGVLCGLFILHTTGQYGMLHVYGDDPTTPEIDEGAKEGDALTFKLYRSSTGVLYETADLKLTSGSPIGSFVASFIPPVWGDKKAYSLDISAITPEAVNRAPAADAGPDQIVMMGETVTLGGGRSTDPDGDPLSYKWTQTGGPVVTLSDANSMIAAFVPADAGVLTFELVVSDGKLDSNTDTIQVMVNEPPNSVPVSNAGKDQVVLIGSSVTLDGSGSTDTDGDGLSYQWTQTSGPLIILSGSSSINPTFISPESGVYTFTLVVSDGGAASSPDSVVITAGSVPVADAGDDLFVEYKTAVTLTGSKSYDPDGGVLSYRWTQTKGPAALFAGLDSLTPQFTPQEVGTYIFELTVTDSDGFVSAPDQVSVFAVHTSPAIVQTVSAVTGGSVEVTGDSTLNSLSIIIPAGSLQEDTTISVNAVPESPPMDAGIDGIGVAFNLEPEGLSFLVPVEINMPYDPDTLNSLGIQDVNTLRVYYYNKGSQTWEEVQVKSVDEVAHRIIFEVTHFSVYRLGVKKVDTEQVPEPVDSSTDSSSDVSSGGGSGGGGCFIATAAFGSYEAPYVKLLRDFRDQYLLTNYVGKIFVRFYYTYSPPIAQFIQDRENLKALVRIGLLPLIGMSFILLKTTLFIKLLTLTIPIVIIVGLLVLKKRKRMDERIYSSSVAILKEGI